MSLAKSQKIIILLVSVLFILTLTLMIHDYIVRPPISENNNTYRVTGNIKGSIYKYIPLVIIEYITMISLIALLKKIKIVYRIAIGLALALCTIVAHIITIELGGVEAAHALWITALLFVYAFSFIVPNKRRLKKTSN